ncbi:uncharacterized protein PHALS_12656 [Plasmopara halstedii]|uniref:Uncharacterized protein n=1 Tax=Plasmopara halstedii TaxID=4781 RepID=A0A0P1ANH0_PLAHL|nr:uncharacterized protein PHALS_12656 [Plasmopara halstedii]CEG42374.1 hypothetical protein PHALS_12656 [Plasmopara halstedii]|eukprot:XP_024578743.1 hypothetical protein PHALS_12656 [Plasmopara halstedii]
MTESINAACIRITHKLTMNEKCRTLNLQKRAVTTVQKTGRMMVLLPSARRYPGAPTTAGLAC